MIETSLLQLQDKGIQNINTSTSLESLDALRISLLGKKGQLTEILKGLKNLSKEERPKIGQLANTIKEKLTRSIESQKQKLKKAQLDQELEAIDVDTSLPGIKTGLGRLHPITQVMRKIIAIFNQLGFTLKQGPEIEDDYHNFEALNIPAHHPSRDMHDTFYLNSGQVLRTHTSPVQIRTMLQQKPPIKLLAPGKVFRCDSDTSHSPIFHQIEGLYVAKGVNFAQLRGCLTFFLHHLFGQHKPIRFRPSYFPFTEPSVEVDVECVACKGKGCRLCKHTGWLEILGAGMVNHKVLDNVEYDPEKVSGFAFGMGVERVAMILYQISDIRLFFENDLRFLRQF